MAMDSDMDEVAVGEADGQEVCLFLVLLYFLYLFYQLYHFSALFVLDAELLVMAGVLGVVADSLLLSEHVDVGRLGVLRGELSLQLEAFLTLATHILLVDGGDPVLEARVPPLQHFLVWQVKF